MQQHPHDNSNAPPPMFWSACYEPPPTLPDAEPPPLAEVMRHPLVRRKRVRTIYEVRDVAKLRHPLVIPILLNALNDSTLHKEARDGLKLVGDPAYRHLLKSAENAKKKSERLNAVIALGDWADGRAVPILLHAMKCERREAAVQKGVFWTATVGAVGAIGVAVVALLVAASSGIVGGGGGGGWGYWGGGWGGSSSDSNSAGSGWRLTYATEMRRAAADSLARIGDPRAIAPLIQMMRDNDVDLSPAALSALLILIPKVATLRMEQAHLLPAETVPQLATLLESWNSTLVRYTLDALHAIGDGRALPAVTRLAMQPPPSDTDRYALREYARYLIPILRERARHDAQRQTLLRGASAPTTPNELLRPVSGKSHPSHASSELLRPTSANPEN